MNAQSIKNLIEELLRKLTIEFEQVEVVEAGLHGMLQFHIATKDSRLLIGNHGSSLNSLTHIVRQMVRKRLQDGELPSFLIDINRYRTKQVEELLHNANLLAQRARLFKREVEMLPMPPYERMIVHAHFADDPEISTESEGEGKFRRVVIRYQGESTNPEV